MMYGAPVGAKNTKLTAEVKSDGESAAWKFYEISK